MMMSTVLMKASHVGVRELRIHLSSRLKSKNPLVVTEHGTPTKVIISYQDMVDLVEILDELQDPKALYAVNHARRGLKRGARGIPVSRLFRRLRSASK